MLLMWDAVEADFQRDYRIDLTQQLDHLSWRRFLALLNNLNPYGAVATRIQIERDKRSTEDSDPVTDEAAANAFFSKIVSI